MKMSEFYQELASTTKKLKWSLAKPSEYSPRRELRARFKSSPNSNKCFCPITAVCYEKTGKYFPAHKVDEANQFVGLHHRHRDRVVDGADNVSRNNNGKIVRKRLLQVLNLKD
jgi:hypothetical protein